ncbi:MAG: TolC family protein [Henriciella sp.]|nr:TolC family protein [Henriciella sp.]
MRSVLAVTMLLSPLTVSCAQFERETTDRSVTVSELAWSEALAPMLQDVDKTMSPLQDRVVDEQLARLIELALENNPDLDISEARIAEARALSQQDLSRFGPQLNAGGSVTGTRQSENGTLPVGEIAAFETEQIIYEAGFDASWELDLFGRRDVIGELGALGVDAEAFNLRSTKSSLIADLARAYIDAQAAMQELSLITTIADRQTEVRDATAMRRDFGEASNLDVERANVSLAVTLARRPALAEASALAKARLATLTGQPVSALELEPSAEFEVFSEAGGIAEAASDTLRRRPDILLAEVDYAIAAASVDLAKLDYYPSFSLFAAVGPEATDLGDIFDPASLAASLGGLVDWALLDGGRRSAGDDIAQARLTQSDAAYRAAVLRAVEDIEASAVSLSQTQAELQDRIEIMASRRRISEMSQARYEGGTGTLIDVLETEQDLIEAEITVLRLRARQTIDQIALEKALGLILPPLATADEGEGI